MDTLKGRADVEVRYVAGSLGVEVRNLDLRKLDDQDWQFIEALWLDNLVVVFRDQELTPDEHIRFARRFGEPESHHPVLDKLDDEHPEIVVISSERGSASIWHTDVTFQDVPAKASVLRMAASPGRGGNTLFSNQSAAYEALSPSMQEYLLTLSAVHTARGLGRLDIQAEHPVVVKHPVTGRRCLYVNRSFTSHIVQLRPAESDALLDFLWSWSERPEFQCRYQWDEGDIGVWDNRCTQHYAASDFVGYRCIQRVTLCGDARPEAAGHPMAAYDADIYERYRSRSHVIPPQRA